MPSKFSRAILAVRNQTCISLSQIVNTNSSNLDAAVLKATTRHPEPADQRYVDEILQTISSNKLNAAICANAIAKRIGKTNNWVVALKSLMLLLRIFQDGDPFFPQEVVHARSRGAKILNLTTFKDNSHSSPYDYTAFVRAFAFYLDQRLDCFITGKQVRRSRRVNQQPVQEMKPMMLLDRLSYWQRLLDQAIATKPTAAAKNNRLVQFSLKAIVRESFDLYRDISDGLGLLLNSFFHLQHQSRINAFQYCVKATRQFEQLSSFYDYCKDLGIGKISEYPRVQQISDELMETLREFLKDQASLPSQHGSECMSLEDLMYQTECDEPISPSFLPGHYSEVAEEQCNEQEDMYNVHETGSNHSLPIQTSVTIDFGSFDDWLMGDIKSQVLQSSAMVDSTNGGDSLFDNSVQQDHKQEQGFENGANGLSLLGNWVEEYQSKEASQNGAKGHSFVNDNLQGNELHEQDHLNVTKGHSYFDDYQFVGNGHSLFVDDWLRDDRKDPEEQQRTSALNSSNDGCKEGWELVLAEATPQPAQTSQHLAYGIEPSMAIVLFDRRPIVPQRAFNPFLEDEADLSPYIATTAINTTIAFPVEFSMAPTFQAAPPTFSIQDPNKMARPTFQATQTSLSEDNYRTTVAFQDNVSDDDDPFAPWPTMKESNNASFNGSDDQENLLLQQELWLQNQNKILNKAAYSFCK
ncbi:AP180 protein [Hibiscus syriacus]|uniref:AP180 protein n=1 Tax=Hibiscus syriacus TaxID=106335 RepID=A0A6A2XSV0_HIBSY|nr:clathrin coat assembly protein AP180-like [Hibiscus syriacus]KAE8679711.1 AP180 protein [Hibiscus syriacus]